MAGAASSGSVRSGVVESLDLRGISASYRDSGSASYRPAVLLSLLIYGCATGVCSSRKLERATFDSVALRFIAANDHPDHDTIATFRRRFLPRIEGKRLVSRVGVGHLTVGFPCSSAHADTGSMPICTASSLLL